MRGFRGHLRSAEFRSELGDFREGRPVTSTAVGTLAVGDCPHKKQ
jgi:hypothetical protein